MRLFCAPMCMAILWTPWSASNLAAQAQQPPSNVPTFHVTSNLVVLDVTVVDKSGRPVVTGLTQNDFTITEDKKPQPIFSFEPPEMHVIERSADDDNPQGKAPVTILVLDQLNSSFADFAYIRYETKRFLLAQKSRLASPMELMVIGDNSLEMRQGYTRSRTDLLDAVNHLPTVLPFKKMNAAFFWERFAQSIDALQEIALQNEGIPGRKNVVWIGHGGPNLYLETQLLPASIANELKQYVHSTTNRLVDARISLFVIYPGLPVAGATFPFSAGQAGVDLGDDDPFTGDINFGVLVNETGGKLFYNRNDVDREIKQSVKMGAEYYTLTYQPENVEPNGKFRRIRVTLRDPNLHAVTKAGYFAPDKNAPIDARQQEKVNLAEAAQSTIPLNALSLSLSDVVRHPDTRTVEFTVQLKSKNVAFRRTEDGKNTAKLLLGATSLSKIRQPLTDKIEGLTLTANSSDPARLPDVVSRVPLMIRVPRKTQSVRVVVEDEDDARMGAAELDWKIIAAAPATPTPEPSLSVRGPESTSPTPPPQP